MHRLLPLSAIAGVSVVCALGPWFFSEPYLLRGLAAGAAATAVVGAIIMRRWDAQAGKRVAELTRARASDEWRFEEQVAELESDLDESRGQRRRLEEKLRAKRAELAGLRNEHAALLRRYATAESERASALENRRLLAVEASAEASSQAPSAETPAPPATARALTAGSPLGESAQRTAPAPVTSRDGAGEGVVEDGDGQAGTGTRPTAPGIFSPAGSALFLRAGAALNRMGGSGAAKAASAAGTVNGETANAETDVVEAAAGKAATAQAATAEPDFTEEGTPQAGGAGEGEAETEAAGTVRPATADGLGPAAAGEPAAVDASAVSVGSSELSGSSAPSFSSERPDSAQAHRDGPTEPSQPTGPTSSAAGDGFVAPAPEPSVAAPALPDRSSGHFTVPTAVAVVPAAPRRRPAVEGGFDFFGTQKDSAAVEDVQVADVQVADVQNEDLADVAGEEALALHKAEGEPEFKAADENVRDVGQVIDLTAHDETERIDLEGLRSAAS
ncbi:hypothetical protein [Streptomyces sp. CRN 30]|uniref:coiled-coil domain-containing protein n=1 Tax=Streptomyces sp. CRN 30 TaxID=3075613 RepID=UPI002A80BAD6|nr:hypothetical protein [Streptomyces sp. CRN 30]